MKQAYKIWKNMPEFVQEKQKPYAITKININNQQIICRFENQKDVEEFSNLIGVEVAKTIDLSISVEELSSMIGQPLTTKTKSIWHPKLIRGINSKKRYTSDSVSNRYPIYIVSKGRYNTRLTMKALDMLNTPYRVIIEQSEYDLYAEHISEDRLLVLPQVYLDEYDTFDDLGYSRSKGPGAARNFALDHSKNLGFKRHWVMDDNLDDFHRLNRNIKAPVRTSACFLAAENFVDRYTNVPVAGLNYYSFCKTTDSVPPLKLNTRIYSCLLIDNHSGYRWRGRYNEDTDLSLRVLKDGYCTIQFNAFLCGKVTTQRMGGGNTKEFYKEEGTLPKSQMLADMHPDVAKVVYKFNRWHHHVDYKPFEQNQLILRDDYIEIDEINEYGMKLVDSISGGKL